MATPKPRVKVPKSAAAGEVITIKTLINHSMESGQRKDKEGKVIPRQIINKFTCAFNGTPVFACDIDPAISANPYFERSEGRRVGNACVSTCRSWWSQYH